MNENEMEFNLPPASPRPMRPAFAQELNARLQALPADPALTRASGTRWRMAAAGGAVFVLVALLVFSPTVRVAAESFLNLFRVQRVIALAVDPARVESLRRGGLSDAGIESLIGDAMVEDETVIKAQGQPRQVVDANTAARETGLSVRLPATVASDPTAAKIFIRQAQTVHFRGNVARLNSLLQTLGVTDATIPAQLEGALVTVTKPAAVMMRWNENVRVDDDGGKVAMPFTLIQAPSPSVELPEGMNLAQLGEIGLRIIGIAPVEARQIAQTTDWNSTLLLPIPTNVGSFRNVPLNNGATGLLVTTGSADGGEVQNSQQKSMIMWVQNNVVYAITGSDSRTVITVANSLQ